MQGSRIDENNLFAFVRSQDPPLEIAGVMRSLAGLLGAETNKHPVSSTWRSEKGQKSLFIL